jgi:hypothetical protein
MPSREVSAGVVESEAPENCSPLGGSENWAKVAEGR